MDFCNFNSDLRHQSRWFKFYHRRTIENVPDESKGVISSEHARLGLYCVAYDANSGLPIQERNVSFSNGMSLKNPKRDDLKRMLMGGF